ncbi:MAG: segregation/condensation protein A [Methanomassiliicoccales archaeon]
MSRGLEGVLEHLMFHKSLISEKDEAKLDRYLAIAREYQSGQDVLAKDPLDHSLKLVFELVLNNNFDPWDVDLVSFTDLYLQRMRDSEINFIVAGKLVFMAWSILKMQSEEVLAANEEKSDIFCSEWDFDTLEECFSCDGSDRILEDVPESIDLCEAVRHQQQRPVSLVELLDAFEAARQEAEWREQRARMREAMRAAEQKFDPKSHAEDLERDVEEVWKRILKCGAGPVALEDLFIGGKEDRITVFVSLLFLARNGKIAIWQDDLPYGQIFLEIKLPWDIGTLEDAKETEKAQHPNAVM